ncbi:Cation/H(+) antiporter 20-like [Forsythia ovata]|uniref:Cation/H(+) antiporter 20-like n=1 Tax=Forsythia ovata TaxID=205694 RepID=A0ABD1XEM5_9LAMI
MTDLIGIHAIFGAFVFGLMIPKGRDFDENLIERIEDFMTGLLLPLYFASSGLKTDVAKIKGGKAWGLLVLVISTTCAGKIIGTFSVAILCMIPARESITLGVLMNTKGLVELIVLNIGKEKKATPPGKPPPHLAAPLSSALPPPPLNLYSLSPLKLHLPTTTITSSSLSPLPKLSRYHYF